MSETIHQEYRDLIRRLFEDELDRAGDLRLFAHLRECTSCEHAYQRWSTAERAMSGRDVPLTKLEADRVLRRLMTPTVAQPAARPLGWLVAPAALSALLAVLVLSRAEPEFTARGVAVAEPPIAVRVLVLRGEGAELRVSDLGSTVRAGDRLRILCSAREATSISDVKLTTASGRELAIASDVRLDAGALEVPLGELIEVSASWGASAALRVGDVSIALRVGLE